MLRMSSDMSRLLNELSMTLENLSPEIDVNKAKARIEELLSNYNIERKSFGEIEKDIDEKVEFFLSAIKLEGFSETTVYDYQLELKMFSEYMSKPLAQVTTPDIRSYLSTHKDIMQSTMGKKLFVLRSFFGWLVKEEYLLKNPTLRISPPKKPERISKGLSIEELEKVRESCETLRQRSILEVAYSSACRLSEIENMNISDINFQEMSMNVIGKGNKERTVYLSEKAMYHLKKYLESRNDDCDALFVTVRKPYRRMLKDSLQREIRLIEQRSKIKSKLTMHILRHSFANLAMSNGIELSDLQAILGHSSPETTMVYAQVSENRKKQAHSRFHVQ